MNTERIIAETLVGKLDRDTATARIACHTAACQQISCGCGRILDSQKTVVITVKTPARRQVFVHCDTCWNRDRERIISAARETETPCSVETWGGVEFSQGDVD